jgi:hypothetical protein
MALPEDDLQAMSNLSDARHKAEDTTPLAGYDSYFGHRIFSNVALFPSGGTYFHCGGAVTEPLLAWGWTESMSAMLWPFTSSR